MIKPPFLPALLLPKAIRPEGGSYFVFLNWHGAPICSSESVDLDTQSAVRIGGLDDREAVRIGLTPFRDLYLFYDADNAPWLGRRQWTRYCLILEAVLRELRPHGELPPMPEWAAIALERACGSAAARQD